MRNASTGTTAAAITPLASAAMPLKAMISRESQDFRQPRKAFHAFNGALFGLAHHEVRRMLPVGSRKLALGMALAEHVSLYPLCYLVDRYHPARGEPGIPPLLTNWRAFAQATWRHALFGILLGQLALSVDAGAASTSHAVTIAATGNSTKPART